jgi:transcriptional regulator with XRE-family HTH domain
MNMTETARLTNVSQPTLTNYETGKESPPLQFLRASMEAYKIQDRKKRMQFLLSALESSEKIEIPLKGLGPLRREWLAAFCVLYDIDQFNPTGWDDLCEWLDDFITKVKTDKPTFVTGSGKDNPI